MEIPHLKVVRPTTDFSLRIYTNSILEAANMCPMWGVIRYGHRKVYKSSARAMALEYGSALHEVFAANRIWQLARVQGEKKLAKLTAERIFGKERATDCFRSLRARKVPDPRDELLDIGFAIIHSGEFFDDDYDTMRTVTNMEQCAIKCAEEQLKDANKWHIYVNTHGLEPFVGIEHVFDITLEYSDGRHIRFVGTADAVLLKLSTNRLYLGENKSGARLSDAWRESFKIKHQLTGYCVASTTFLGETCFDARVYGIKSQQTGSGEDYAAFEEERKPEDILYWGDWVRHTADIMENYHENWEYAPRYSHSCNRYFRACSMIPFCHTTPEDRREQFEDMELAYPSPSEMEIIKRGHAPDALEEI